MHWIQRGTRLTSLGHLWFPEDWHHGRKHPKCTSRNSLTFQASASNKSAQLLRACIFWYKNEIEFILWWSCLLGISEFKCPTIILQHPVHFPKSIIMFVHIIHVKGWQRHIIHMWWSMFLLPYYDLTKNFLKVIQMNNINVGMPTYIIDSLSNWKGLFPWFTKTALTHSEATTLGSPTESRSSLRQAYK